MRDLIDIKQRWQTMAAEDSSLDIRVEVEHGHGQFYAVAEIELYEVKDGVMTIRPSSLSGTERTTLECAPGDIAWLIARVEELEGKAV